VENQPAIIRYQTNTGLDEVEAYTAGLQLRMSDNKPVYIALSDLEFSLHFGEEIVLHYDLEGRLVMFAHPDRYLRRSLSHHVLLTRKLTAEEGGGIARTVLPSLSANELVAKAHKLTGRVHWQLISGAARVEFGKPSSEEARRRLEPYLAKAIHFDAEAARADARRFQTVYGRVAVLPPDQYNALVVQATEGCAYNHCLFCDLYCGVRFHRKTAAQFRQHLDEVISYHGTALRARRSIFLGEANALTLPQPELVEMFQIMREKFEVPAPDAPQPPASWWMGKERRFDGISSFQDVFVGPDRTASEYAQLRELGLRRVYIGMESGDAGLLKWLRKPASAESITNTVKALKEAGIAVGVIVLLGAGGRQFAEAHVRESVRVLNELPLSRGDYIYFSPLEVHPEAAYALEEANDQIVRLSEEELREQEADLKRALRFDEKRGKPYVARYELAMFVY
jgi:radical SAM superfamily enzyme YgiQ (UPF0313 family)